MNNNFIIVILVSAFISCKPALKDAKDYYPKVETVMAEVQDDGSVKVTGRLLKSGESQVDYYGFCMSKQPIPALEENQVSMEKRSGNMFETTFDNLDMNTKYYFRTWANNDFGYSMGNVIELDSIKPPGTLAPCIPEVNSVEVDGLNTNEHYYQRHGSYYLGFWVVSALGDSHDDYFYFKNKPTTGIYTTVDNTANIADQTVMVNLKYSSGELTIDKGSKVYVQEVETDKIEITICKAPFIYSGTPSKNYLTLRCQYYK